MIEVLDIHIRWMGVGAGLLLMAAISTGEARHEMKVALIGLILGAIAYLLNETPLGAPETGYDPWIDLLSLLTPFWAWIFARRLFEREPPFWAIAGSAAVLTAAWFTGNFITTLMMIPYNVIHIVSLILLADLVRVAWRDRADDLIEKRRAIRLILPLMVAALAAGILIFELIVGRAIPYPAVQLTNAVLILVLTLFAGIALLRTETVLLVETADDAPENTPAPTGLSPSETVLHQKLTAAMEGGYYRTPGLSISGLAEHLETPEHRLRALINQRLGYRNFAAFLNRHRITEAKAILANPDKVDLPVLTIAMDLGYNSLPTFNRAFRSETSVTPTDFRKSAIGQN
ncbi:AraC family transcriptional regulator [Qipengyuania sp. DGS5-3]|uniref:AraC family transcriptional regulator n=1 Tax=Qipengyuania sp. DGS5-3 TaxID=3349632 RepID=UPI0036D425BF